jgi:XisH protein
MPARDRYHQQVKNALLQDGWIITHDPLRLQWGLKDMFVDLGAERLLAAEKDHRRIAVEVKSLWVFQRWKIWSGRLASTSSTTMSCPEWSRTASCFSL